MPKVILFSFVFVLTIPQLGAQIADSLADYSIDQLGHRLKELREIEEYGQMLPYAQAALAKAEQEYGKQDTIYARMLYQLGFAYDYNDNFEKGMDYYQQAANLQKKLAPNSLDYANTLNDIANIYNYNWAEYEKALPLYLQSKNIYKKVLGAEHPDFATSLHNLAVLYQSMGEYEKALLLYIQSKNIRKKALGTEHPYFATSLNNSARLYESMGEYEKALPLYIQAKNIYKKVLGTEHPDFATSLNNLAGLYERMGEYEKALSLYLQARSIRKKALGIEHPYFAASLNNLALLYKRMGEYEKALPLYIQAKGIVEKALGKEHPYFATSLNNLAGLYESMGEYEKVLPLYLQARSIRKKALGTEHPDFAQSLHNLAGLYESMGEYEKALPLYLQTIEIEKKALGTEHPDFATSLNNIAVLYERMGNYAEAWQWLHQAMNSSSMLTLQHRFDQAWLDSLAAVPYPSNRHLEEMIISLEYAYSLLEKDSSITNSIQKQIIVADLATALLARARNQVSNEQDKLRMLAKSNNWLINGLEVLTPEQHSSKAFELSDQNKSVLLLQATKSEAAYRLGGLPDSLVWNNKKMLKKQSQLQAKLYEKRSVEGKKELRNQLNEVNQDLDAFVKMLEKEYPKYHKLKYQQVDAKVEEIQALLDEQTALIEYVIADSAVHVFRVDKKGVLWHQEAIVDSILIDKVEQLHQSLSDYTQIVEKKEENFKAYAALSHWFYQKLLAPVLKAGDGIENLIIITDGELGHLPFESFLVEPANDNNYKELHYLLKDYHLSYNYSATLWKENKETEKSNNNGQMLAMAASYDEDLDANLLRGRLPTTRQTREALQPLPAARAEVEALEQQYRGFFAFDSLASEKVLLEKAREYAIIHLAMHGLLDENRPMLSSLALTENGDSLYDNFWQAHEISKLELTADLVVLSACETGYGKFEQGNGIASLARAFMYAGVPSLVVSLWQVNDQSTSIIMQNFYKHLSSGMTKSAALRQAKLDYIVDADNLAAHPAFWSPFILIGDEAPVELQRKSNGSWLWWSVGGLGLLGLMGFLGFRGRRKEASA
jgi:CHAT domain-containing protein/tetratricopeptide (TPR) repeat protein